MANFIVTITGADDAVDPKALMELSNKYEFVEWAILFSATSPGTNRYPSRQWRSALYDLSLNQTVVPNLAAHVCGSFADQRLQSFKYMNTEIEYFYRRVQFNRFNHGNAKDVLEYSFDSGIPTIIPCNTNCIEAVNSLEHKGHLQLLFDKSGGRGKLPDSWPEHNEDFALCGYAGGITDTNVDNVLSTLSLRYGKNPFWIDMETGARTEDKFDLGKVSRILESASKYYGDTESSIILLN